MYTYQPGMGAATGCPVPYGWAPPAMPLVFGADPTPAPPANESFMDKTKRVLGQQNSLVGVKNGTLLGIAAVVGLGYWGYTHRWFK